MLMTLTTPTTATLALRPPRAAAHMLKLLKRTAPPVSMRTTVMPSVADGKYCFGIHKFAGDGAISQVSTDINGAAKAATVTVQGDGLAQTFTVPSSNPSSYEYWRVYTVEFESGAVKSGTFTEYNDLVETAETDCNW